MRRARAYPAAGPACCDTPFASRRRGTTYDLAVKRSDALAPLSREHHVALEVALRLRRATDADAADAQGAFLRFYEDEARKHFRAEEELLLPAFAAHAGPEDPDATRVVREHQEIDRRARELAGARGSLANLHALGELLSGHVRHEERTLFPRVEAALTSAELDALGAALAAQGAVHDPPRA